MKTVVKFGKPMTTVFILKQANQLIPHWLTGFSNKDFIAAANVKAPRDSTYFKRSGPHVLTPTAEPDQLRHGGEGPFSLCKARETHNFYGKSELAYLYEKFASSAWLKPLSPPHKRPSRCG